MAKSNIKLRYTVKDEKGYVHDRVRKFPTVTDANVYLQFLRSGGQVIVGIPVMEVKG